MKATGIKRTALGVLAFGLMVGSLGAPLAGTAAAAPESQSVLPTPLYTAPAAVVTVPLAQPVPVAPPAVLCQYSGYARTITYAGPDGNYLPPACLSIGSPQR